MNLYSHPWKPCSISFSRSAQATFCTVSSSRPRSLYFLISLSWDFLANGSSISSTLGTVKPPYCWLAALRTMSPMTSKAVSSVFGSLYHRFPISNPPVSTDFTSKRQQFMVSLLADMSWM